MRSGRTRTRADLLAWGVVSNPADAVYWFTAKEWDILKSEPGQLDRLVEVARSNEASWRQFRLQVEAQRGASEQQRQECGEAVLSVRSDARYCSTACRQKAYRARRTQGARP